MKRSQRIGLAALLVTVIVLQATISECLHWFTPLHIPIASIIMLWVATIGGALLLILGEP